MRTFQTLLASPAARRQAERRLMERRIEDELRIRTAGGLGQLVNTTPPRKMKKARRRLLRAQGSMPDVTVGNLLPPAAPAAGGAESAGTGSPRSQQRRHTVRRGAPKVVSRSMLRHLSLTALPIARSATGAADGRGAPHTAAAR